MSARRDAEVRLLEAQGTPEAVLTIHQRVSVGACGCGWSELGKSHAAHQAEELRRAGLLRLMGRTWSVPFMPSTWVDGDTVHGTLDTGWGHVWTPKKGVRLLFADGTSFDAIERKGATLALSRIARARATELCPPGRWHQVVSHYVDPDDFARPLCSITLLDGRDLARVLTDEGYAKGGTQ